MFKIFAIILIFTRSPFVFQYSLSVLSKKQNQPFSEKGIKTSKTLRLLLFMLIKQRLIKNLKLRSMKKNKRIFSVCSNSLPIMIFSSSITYFLLYPSLMLSMQLRIASLPDLPAEDVVNEIGISSQYFSISFL